MKGGFGCSPCCGPQNPCPECRHYTVDTYYETAEIAVTVNGSAVPSWDPSVTAVPASYLYITPSGAVQSTCFSVGDTPKRARLFARYRPDEDAETIDLNGCFTRRVFARLSVSFPESSFVLESTTVLIFQYDIGLNCSDTGGTGIAGEWSFDAAALPEDCYIEYLDWLNSLTIEATFSWDPCECPP